MRLNILTEEIEDIMECRRKAVEQNKSGVVLPIPEFTESAFSFQF
jgi:hypothetical protein